MTFIEKLWAIGGSDGVETLFSTEFFDFTTNTWNKGPNLTSRRANTGVANVNNKLFAVGGFSGNTKVKRLFFSWKHRFQDFWFPG